jgi:hypothetical protein
VRRPAKFCETLSEPRTCLWPVRSRRRAGPGRPRISALAVRRRRELLREPHWLGSRKPPGDTMCNSVAFGGRGEIRCGQRAWRARRDRGSGPRAQWAGFLRSGCGLRTAAGFASNQSIGGTAEPTTGGDRRAVAYSTTQPTAIYSGKGVWQ